MVNAQMGAKILTVINGIVSKRTEDGLVLDVSLGWNMGWMVSGGSSGLMFKKWASLK